LPIGYSHLGGVPVYDSLGQVPFRLPFHYIGGVAFSPAGDTLYAVYVDSLAAFDATTGARLAGQAVGDGNESRGGYSVAVDGPWLYLCGFMGGTVVVQVHDRRTLARVATLKVPSALVPVTNTLPLVANYVPIVDVFRRRLYLTMNYTVTPTHVFEFDLLP